MSKYGDSSYDSPVDAAIFNKAADLLVEPCHNLGLTPNMVTLLSTALQILCIVPLLVGWPLIAVLLYLFGYTLDCVDGKMARIYNQGTPLGMVMDFNSDMLVNAIVLSVSIYVRFNPMGLLIVLAVTFLDNLYYGFVEAISAYRKQDTDDFVALKTQALSGMAGPMKALFLAMHKTVYNQYKYLMYNVWPRTEKYDSIKAHNYLKFLRYFGPGTNCLVIAFYLWNLDHNIILSFFQLETKFLTVASAYVAYNSYTRFGMQSYFAHDVIHFGGIVMGFVIITFSDLETTSGCIIYAVGVVLTTFHVCYELERTMLQARTVIKKEKVEQVIERGKSELVELDESPVNWECNPSGVTDAVGPECNSSDVTGAVGSECKPPPPPSSSNWLKRRVERQKPLPLVVQRPSIPIPDQ